MTETFEGWTAIELWMPEGVAEDDDRLDVLGAAMFELGTSGLETKERDGRPVLTAAFPPGVDVPGLVELVRDEVLPLVGLEDVTISTEPYAPIDWATHWRQHFHAIRFGATPEVDPDKSVWIVPTWIETPAGAKHVLRIDPSSAFGTGLHPTTAMCLERVLELSPISSVLDVGTGTGILALAALELGTTRAVATDNDPSALVVAAENAEQNGMKDRLVISGDDPGALGEQFDVVVANILARPLIELAPEIVKAVRPGGRLVLSGITKGQVEDVVAAYEAEGLTRDAVSTREEWARVDLLRP
ncbi:50S ribosomal protein L11 methyltransferase [Myxococcota bacterium]|nr:50S ribosomal protein L11 methyltransferase [Myxococcota bacterium]